MSERKSNSRPNEDARLCLLSVRKYRSKQEVKEIMDPHRQFRTVIYHWLRFLGKLLGHDILFEGSRMNAYTIVLIIYGASLVFACVWSFAIYEGKEAWDGGSYILMAFKVSHIFSSFLTAESLAFYSFVASSSSA